MATDAKAMHNVSHHHEDDDKSYEYSAQELRESITESNHLIKKHKKMGDNIPSCSCPWAEPNDKCSVREKCISKSGCPCKDKKGNPKRIESLS